MKALVNALKNDTENVSILIGEELVPKLISMLEEDELLIELRKNPKACALLLNALEFNILHGTAVSMSEKDHSDAEDVNYSLPVGDTVPLDYYNLTGSQIKNLTRTELLRLNKMLNQAQSNDPIIFFTLTPKKDMRISVASRYFGIKKLSNKEDCLSALSGLMENEIISTEGFNAIQKYPLPLQVVTVTNLLITNAEERKAELGELNGVW